VPKRQRTQWGISFSTEANDAGYCWRRDPISGKTVLDVKGRYEEVDGSTTVAPGGFETTTIRNGIDESRRAIRAFLALAREIEKLMRWDTITPFPDGSTEHSYRGERISWTDREHLLRDKVRDFANRFGSLRGEAELLTLHGWIKSAKRFVQLNEVASALETADFIDFDSSVRIEQTGVFYAGRHERWAIARKGTSSDEREGNARAKLDWYQEATSGSSRTRAWMVFSVQVNRALEGGLSLQAHSLLNQKAYIEPRSLEHLLYVRLWLDVVGHEQLEREANCRNCGATLNGTARKAYCDDRCRKAFHRRNRSLGLPHSDGRPM